jgi:hypothetical protein
MKLKCLTIFGLIGFLGAWGWSGVQTSQAQSGIKSETLTINGRDFTSEVGADFAVTEAGLTMVDDVATAVYTSAPIVAPIPFSALVPSQIAHVPEGSSLQVRLRTQKAGGAWSPWQSLHAHADWNDEHSDTEAGDMIVVPAADVTHDLIQFELSTSRFSDETPTLQQLEFIFIDASAGPTAAELVAQQQALDAAQNANPPATTEDFARPFVISRAAWCTDPACNYTNDIYYQPVTHLLMHHTVTTSNGDSAATMRAIWYYHAITLGWDDIGIVPVAATGASTTPALSNSPAGR